ncbi:MAG: fumarylacetoacetate hydrolase family protein [Proteobacteria bacterium]|nr:fumarylacetoacetate hydrolase family protein [Pseudomonadota bacterium]
MKLAVNTEHRIGVVEGDQFYDVTDAVPGAGPAWPPMYMNRLIAEWAELGPKVAAARKAASPVPLSAMKLLPPNPCPVHVIAAPANYRKHIGEIGARSVSKGRTAEQQGFFMKSTASLVGAGGAIELPRGSTRRFDHESELAVIIGKRARNVPRAEAMDYVFGYSCLMDITMRIEPGVAEEERVTRKSFETFTPLGPWIVTADEVADPHALRNQLWVNGVSKQDANTRDMIVNIPTLIELISSVMTLNPGDVIASGTPEGVGPIVPGDSIRIGIESVGEMTLSVVEAATFSPRRF